MSVPTSTATFTPKSLMPVAIGRQTVNLYPVIDTTMCAHERAYAFHVNKTNLANVTLTPRQMLTALGQQIGQETSIQGEISDFLHRFNTMWNDFSQLSILSFHDSIGNVINNTTTIADDSILLPVQDGALLQCRSPDVRFVYVRADVDYSDKIDAGVRTFRTEYFVELPHTTHNMTNGAGAAYALTTFGGPDDLRLYTLAERNTLIFTRTLQTYAAQLKAPGYGAQRAMLDTITARSDIELGILTLAYETITMSAFISLAPNYTTQPHAAIELIFQVYQSSDGKPITRSVQEYHSLILKACHPFANDSIYPVNVCSKFVQQMDPQLRKLFMREYPNHSDIVPCDATTQRRTLQLMLVAAQRAEDQRESIASISQSTYSTQAYLTQAHQSASGFPSQAEATMNKYKPKELKCFGCDGPHSWSTKKDDGTYVVSCPNAKNPGVQERATAELAAMRERIKARRKSQRAKKGEKKRAASATTYASLSDEDKKRIKEECTSSLSSPPSGGPKLFIIDVQRDNVQCLTTGPPLLPMPIAISNDLPHTQFQLGPTLDDPGSPLVRVAIDTCAGVSTGCVMYLLALAKSYPHCLHRVYGPKEYAKITLSGIVTDDSHPVSTALDTTFEFHLPYKTKDGEACCLQVAAGTNVAVNIIIGLPFLRKMKGVIDLCNDVLECNVLDHPPFTLEYRRTSNHIPLADAMPQVNTSTSTNVSEIIRELDNLEQYFSDKLTSPDKDYSTRVHFGSKFDESADHALKAFSNVQNDDVHGQW